MAEYVNPDIAALRPSSDFVDNYVNAFRAGQGLGKATSVGPTRGGQIQGAIPSQISAAPNMGGIGGVAALKAQLDAAPAAQHAALVQQAQEHNEQLAHVLLGLKGYPPEQRLHIAQHLAQTSGLLDPSSITADDVTDQGIDSHLVQAMSVAQFLNAEEAARPYLPRQLSLNDFSPDAAAATRPPGAPGERRMLRFNPQTAQVE